MYGLNAKRTLPTIWVHMCSVARVGSQASSGSAGQCGFCSVILGLLSILPSLLGWFPGDLGSRTRQPTKGCNEPIDVFLVVVDVWTDPHAADAGRNVDALGRQPLDQSFRHAGRKLHAQDMRRPHRGSGNG